MNCRRPKESSSPVTLALWIRMQQLSNKLLTKCSPQLSPVKHAYSPVVSGISFVICSGA